MVARKTPRNDRLEEAVALLIQNQASFLARLSEHEERFARIENLLLEHSRILFDHGRILAEMHQMLEVLPEAIREKIGFKPSQ